MAHEVARDGHRDVVVTRRTKPDLAFGAVDEEDVEVFVDSPDVRDRDAEGLERAVHFGLAREPHERADAAASAALQEERAHHAVDGDVDREAAAPTAGHLRALDHPATRRALDPRSGRVVHHGRPTPGTSTRTTSR